MFLTLLVENRRAALCLEIHIIRTIVSAHVTMPKTNCFSALFKKHTLIPGSL